MQKFVFVTVNGLEDVAAQELKEVFEGAVITKKLPGRVILSLNKKYSKKWLGKKIKNLCGIDTVYSLLTIFKFKTLDDIAENTKKIKFGFKGTFAVHCKREGSHDFKANDAEARIGEIIFETGKKVDLKNPDNVVYVDILDDLCLIGFLIVANLCKREYRVRINSRSITGCLAHLVLKLAGVKKNSKVLDPFCKDGVIAIEASLLKCKVYAFDADAGNIKATKINAQLAKTKLNVSSCPLDWIETKFKKHELDAIVTVPHYSKFLKHEELKKMYKELVSQAIHASKRLVVVCINEQQVDIFNELAKGAKLKFEKHSAFVGEMIYTILDYSINP